MYIHGEFLNKKGVVVSVHIVTGGERTPVVEIDGDDSPLQWSDTPVTVTGEVNNTFDHLLATSASITLRSRRYIPELYSADVTDTVVNIYHGDSCVFAGYIEPLALSQNFVEVWDDIELSCIDAISALQYARYRDAGTSADYDEVRTSATTRSLADILSVVLGKTFSPSLDIVGASLPVFLYDGCRALSDDADDHYSIFDGLALPELLFLGDTEDDVWTCREVLTEIMSYLNLHIRQDGLRSFIFGWETVVAGRGATWRQVLGGGDAPMELTTDTEVRDITMPEAADAAGQLSVGEVYNRIELTCSPTDIEDLIENPLDADALTPVFPSRQRYLTEYSATVPSDGTANEALSAFLKLVRGGDPVFENGYRADWYVRLKDNPSWRFNIGARRDVMPGASGLPQQSLVHDMGDNAASHDAIGALIVSLGSVRRDTDHKDNSPVASVTMTDYFVVAVNGGGTDTVEGHWPTDEALLNAAPVAEYCGATAGSSLSPADAQTTNYIVISGDMILNPVQPKTAPCSEIDNTTAGSGTVGGLLPSWIGNTVPASGDDQRRYYTQRYYYSDPDGRHEFEATAIARSLEPYTGENVELFEFTHSAPGDATDTISRVDVLACMLIIGDKCAVRDPETDAFLWQPYRTPEECADIDDYYSQSFTIGINPKIGDKLLGTTHSIQNTISFDMGVDAEGTAIPIKASDRIAGDVRFIVLGPVNTTWDTYTRRHKTWFRSEKWSADTSWLLAHVSNILISNFSIKVYSDNGLYDTDSLDGDIVYISDTADGFVNVYDNLTNRITTALTAEECRALSVANTVKLSSPVLTATSLPATAIYDTWRNTMAKPEQLYVDSYYTEYSRPRVVLTHNIEEPPGLLSHFSHWRHPALDLVFFIQSLTRDLYEGTAELTLKEKWL